VVKKNKLKSIFKIEEELIGNYMQDHDSAWIKQQQYEAKYNTEREHVDPKVKHTKKDHKKSKHKHKSHRHKSKHTAT
jgi:FtsZ-interacting cell division protein YlmF